MAALEAERDFPLDCSPVKRTKIDEKRNKYENGVHETLNDLSTFKLEKILSNNTKAKSVCLQGKFGTAPGDALIVLEKSAFTEEHLTANSDYFTNSQLEKVFHNDIYGNYNYFPQVRLNAVKTTIIHPATEKHITKYSIQNSYIIEETTDIYQKIVLPHLTAEQFNLNWVYNILEHKSESERIAFEDPDPEIGFILLPDLKWNGQIDSLYFLAIVRPHNIKSLRDLNSSHLGLLKNIQKRGIEAIKSKYGLEGTELRIYLHYHPSFYHLHVHFTYLRHEAPGIFAERAHLLANVINNIELLPDYYQKSTLSFTLRENDALFALFEVENLVKKSRKVVQTNNSA